MKIDSALNGLHKGCKHMEIKGCTAIVTGGASGLGEGTVRQLVQDGARVAIVDVDEDRGNRLVSELGKSTIFCKTDITHEKNVQASIDKAMNAFGAIHLALNCAGINSPAKVISKKGSIPIELFNRVLQVNLVGTLIMIKNAAEKMLENSPNADGEKGVIINTASIAAFEGQVGQASYSASKGGIVGMTLPIAREFADYGIRVVTIAPGLFETPMMGSLSEKAIDSLVQMIPFPKRLGRPSEFARTVKHIIENPMFNGATIRLDQAIRMGAK
jgi:NAD(P)-dependent dehydrogenase (short-subunit alcohol dehydrogenase family)